MRNKKFEKWGKSQQLIQDGHWCVYGFILKESCNSIDPIPNVFCVLKTKQKLYNAFLDVLCLKLLKYSYEYNIFLFPD